MNGSFLKNLHKAFATGVFILVISSVASFFVIEESYNRADWVQHTEVVKNKLECLISTVKDAETGVRGYIITGNPIMLEQYNGSRISVQKTLTEIQDLTADNPEQQRSIPLLSKIIDKKFSYLQQNINIKKDGQPVTIAVILKGKASMDELRTIILEMQNREDLLMKHRGRLWNTYRNLSPYIILLIAVIGAVITYYFCSNLKKAYFRNAKLQKILQEEKMDTDKRIKLIHDIVNQVSSGNYQLRLQEKETDVLGSLAVSLNKMTSTLEYSFNALKELMVKKDEFISIAAHELKTPLTSIKAYLQFVGRIPLTSDEGRKIHPFMVKANSQVNRLTDIIRDLLDVTRINEGQLQLQISKFCIREALQEASEQIFSSVRSHKLTIEGETELELEADKFRIEQVLVNLITNGIKYSPDAQELVASVQKENGFAKVSIRDFGIGISEEQLPYLFERYFRVEETSQNYNGMGLGLYISKGIIQQHGGILGVNSTEGKGSVFWFTLPLNNKD